MDTCRSAFCVECWERRKLEASISRGESGMSTSLGSRDIEGALDAEILVVCQVFAVNMEADGNFLG
jgi:hypothetical protein